jgi:hypothetical protein
LVHGDENICPDSGKIADNLDNGIFKV